MSLRGAGGRLSGWDSVARAPHISEGVSAVLALIIVLALLVIGFLTGWLSRGPTGRWCTCCGDALRCPTCSPLPPVGRARVAMHQPPSSTIDGLVRFPLTQQRIQP